MSAKGIAALVGATLLAAAGWYLLRSPPPIATEAQRPAQPASRDAKPAILQPDVGASRAEFASTTPAPTPAPAPAPSADDTRNRMRMREEIEAEIRLLYEDVGRDVRLQANETLALISLLTDQRMHMADSRFENSVAGAAERRELQAQFRREIEEQIGVARAELLANYERSLHARVEVQELQRVLGSESMPMTERQRTTLIQRAVEQGAIVEPTVFTGAESQLARMQEQEARYEQFHQRMAGVARQVLDANQLDRYEAWVASRRESSDKLMQSQEAAPSQR